MSDFAVHAESIGKRYKIGVRLAQRRSIRDDISKMFSFRTWRSALKRGGMSAQDSFIWALKDISFDIKQGEIVGIIGRNGAGKSTLLKILSGITAPTEGFIDLNGRVGTLLEVGTGFHPELTGRENIFLNGAILGMGRHEIARKFDEIVAFSEIEKFIDTPVKRYSSGMYMRLAFAVAAHLEPEILIVDEVLAVGDAAFQRKCLNKMEDVGQQGRTVLFVSHNMNAVTRLCERVILLDGGRILDDGSPHQIVTSYLQSGIGINGYREWPDISSAPGNAIVRLLGVSVTLEDGTITDAIDIRRAVGIRLEYDVLTPGHILVPNIHLFNEESICICVVSDLDPTWSKLPRSVGRYRSTMWIPGNFLAEGNITAAVAISTFIPLTVHIHERDVVAFRVIDSLEGNSARGDYAGPTPGVIRPIFKWNTQMLEPAIHEL